jgi:hypothetical protein
VVVNWFDWNAKTKQAEANAFATNVVTTEATCTLTLTRNGVTRTATRTAHRSAADTQCGTMTIPGSRLSPGDWTAQVTFTAPTAVGTSDPFTVTVAS